MDETVKPWGTWALLAINFVVYVGTLLDGAHLLLPQADVLVRWGALDAVLVWRGEVWRIVAAIFVHGAIWHLALNQWVLGQLGPFLERIIGTSAFLAIYALCGLTGFAMSLLFSPGLSLGASGAIFGVVGALIAWAVLTPHRGEGKAMLRALLPFVVLTFGIGLLLGVVDNAAHFGGLFVGFFVGAGLLPDEHFRPSLRRAALFGIGLVIFGVGLSLSVKPIISSRYHVTMGWTALLSGDKGQAEVALRAAEQINPDDPAVLLFAGRLTDDKKLTAENTRRALLTTDDEDAFRAQQLLLLTIGVPRSAEHLFADERTSAALCDGALNAYSTSPTAVLLNNCAWLLIRAKDPDVGDRQRGLVLARRAVRLIRDDDGVVKDDAGDDEVAAFTHTLAEALARTGKPREAQRTMERLIQEGRADGDFWKQEMRRFAALADIAEQRDATGER